jgi:hypothetical protein
VRGRARQRWERERRTVCVSTRGRTSRVQMRKKDEARRGRRETREAGKEEGEARKARRISRMQRLFPRVVVKERRPKREKLQHPTFTLTSSKLKNLDFALFVRSSNGFCQMLLTLLGHELRALSESLSDVRESVKLVVPGGDGGELLRSVNTLGEESVEAEVGPLQSKVPSVVRLESMRDKEEKGKRTEMKLRSAMVSFPPTRNSCFERTLSRTPKTRLTSSL